MNPIQFDPDGWQTDKPHVKCCKMPFDVDEKEADIYRLLIRHHCQHKNKGSDTHQCCGAITITEGAIVLRCKKCGDAKGLLGKDIKQKNERNNKWIHSLA